MAYNTIAFATKVINRYLYGQDSKPSNGDLIDGKYLSHPQSPKIKIDSVQYMRDIGRFVTAKDFAFVRYFFKSDNTPLNPVVDFDTIAKINKANNLKPGVYTKNDLLVALGYSEYELDANGNKIIDNGVPRVKGVSGRAYVVRKQMNMGSNAADYGLRTLIWNTGAYKINNDARFIVEPNGKRRVENLKIIPFAVNSAKPDNFDFNGGSFLTNVGNTILKSIIDPSAIGKASYFCH